MSKVWPAPALSIDRMCTNAEDQTEKDRLERELEEKRAKQIQFLHQEESEEIKQLRSAIQEKDIRIVVVESSVQ